MPGSGESGLLRQGRSHRDIKAGGRVSSWTECSPKGHEQEQSFMAVPSDSYADLMRQVGPR